MSLEAAQTTGQATFEEPHSYVPPDESDTPLTATSTAVSNVVDEKRGASAPQGPTSSKRVILNPPESGDDSGIYPPTRRATNGSSATGDIPPLKKRLTDLFVSERKVKREPTWKESGMACVKASWLNVLLVFIPVSGLQCTG